MKYIYKKLVKWIFAILVFDLQLSSLLAFLDRTEMAENLSMMVVTAISQSLPMVSNTLRNERKNGVSAGKERRGTGKNQIYQEG